MRKNFPLYKKIRGIISTEDSLCYIQNVMGSAPISPTILTIPSKTDLAVWIDIFHVVNLLELFFIFVLLYSYANNLKGENHGKQFCALESFCVLR